MMLRRSSLGNTPKSSLRVADGRARMDLPSAECACGRKFVKLNTFQAVCIPCARQAGPKKRKEEATKTRAAKEALKTRKDLTQETQAAINKYVRLRDFGQNCIDCDKPFEPQRIGGSVDAGHFRSVGSAPHLRFDLRNIHAQRKNCNRPGGATPAAYEAGLRKRIGDEAVDALLADQEPRHHTIDNLREMRDRYRRLGRELAKQIERRPA